MSFRKSYIIFCMLICSVSMACTKDQLNQSEARSKSFLKPEAIAAPSNQFSEKNKFKKLQSVSELKKNEDVENFDSEPTIDSINIKYVPIEHQRCAFKVVSLEDTKDPLQLLWTSSWHNHQITSSLSIEEGKQESSTVFSLAENEVLKFYAKNDLGEPVLIEESMECDVTKLENEVPVAINVHATHVDLEIGNKVTSTKDKRFLAYVITTENFVAQMQDVNWEDLDPIIVEDARSYKPVFRKKGFKALHSLILPEQNGQKIYVLLVDQAESDWVWTYVTSFVIAINEG